MKTMLEFNFSKTKLSFKETSNPYKMANKLYIDTFKSLKKTWQKDNLMKFCLKISKVITKL